MFTTLVSLDASPICQFAEETTALAKAPGDAR